MNIRNLKELKKKNIIIHIGLHKTATSAMQSEVFPYLDNILFLGNIGIVDLKKKKLISSKLEYDMSDLIFEIMRKRISKKKLKEIKKKFDQIKKIASKKNKKILISAENLSFTKSLKISSIRNKNKISINLLTKRLKEIFEDPIIWVNVRKAKPLAWSTYMYYTRQGKYLSFKTFWKECCVKEFLDWTKMTNIYKKTFGKENMLITSYEQLNKEPNIFWNNLEQVFKTNFSFAIETMKNKTISNQSNARVYNLQKYFPFFYYFNSISPKFLKIIIKNVISYKAKKTIPKIPYSIENTLKIIDKKNSHWMKKNFDLKY